MKKRSTVAVNPCYYCMGKRANECCETCRAYQKYLEKLNQYHITRKKDGGKPNEHSQA